VDRKLSVEAPFMATAVLTKAGWTAWPAFADGEPKGRVSSQPRIWVWPALPRNPMKGVRDRMPVF